MEEIFSFFFLKQLIAIQSFPNNSLNGLVWGICRFHLQIILMEHSASNALMDLLSQLSHSDGTDPGGA